MKMWIRRNRNTILQSDEVRFWISYNPMPVCGAKPETALCIESGVGMGKWTKYLILYGDWREQYEAAFPDLDKCKAIYLANRASHGAFWDEGTMEDEDVINDWK